MIPLLFILQILACPQSADKTDLGLETPTPQAPFYTLETGENNLSVPVLAESASDAESKETVSGFNSEARESTSAEASRRSDPKAKPDSRGAQTSSQSVNHFPSVNHASTALSNPKISVADIFARLVEERRIPFKEPTPIPGNSIADRLKESQ